MRLTTLTLVSLLALAASTARAGTTGCAAVAGINGTAVFQVELCWIKTGSTYQFLVVPGADVSQKKVRVAYWWDSGGTPTLATNVYATKKDYVQGVSAIVPVTLDHNPDTVTAVTYED